MIAKHTNFSIPELAAASLQPENIFNLPSLVTIGAATLFTGLTYSYADDSYAVWNTGSWYWGESEFSPWLGIPLFAGISYLRSLTTGIGEEALYRGVYYEEMKESWGLIPAKIIDAIYFSAVHIPQEIVGGAPAEIIMINWGIRAIISLLAQWCYDEGNLPYAVAAHTWGDTISQMTAYLYTSGSR